MAEQNNDQAGIQSIPVPNWDKGIVTAVPGTEIPDNAAQDILNWEFDTTGNISMRSGVVALIPDTFPGRITSLHHFRTETNEVGLLFTTGTKLYLVQTDGSGLTDKTGSLTLPSDTFWQWRTFEGLAVGVNKATTGSNPVKVDGTGTAAALGGSPPKAKYIESWNSRIWLVGASDPNTVYGSGLGQAENWTIPVTLLASSPLGIDVEADDGDLIMGIYATKDALYIWKRKRIFRIVVIDASKPATDATNLKVELFSPGIGCVSAYSIQAVLDDIYFLSEQGIASLALSQTVEDFRNALLSRDIAEIQRMPKTTDEIPSALLDTASQYHLSIPAIISPTQRQQSYVLDYSLKPFQDGYVRFCRFDGKASGTAYTSWTDDIGKVYVIGALTGVVAGEYGLYLYRPRDTNPAFSDDGSAYVKKIITKAYNADVELLRKEWLKWGLALSLLTDSAQISVKYYFDSIETRGGSYSFSLAGSTAGARWDSAIWDVSLWDSAVAVPTDIWRKPLVNQYGQRGQDITLVITNAQDGEGIQIRDFRILYSLLNELEVSEL